MQGLPDITPADLKAVRATLGLSQAAFGKALCGTPTRTIEDWEGGRRTPPAHLRLALAALVAGLEPWQAI